MRSVLNNEGGYSNHPKDKGGVTYKGISSSFYRSLVKAYPKKYRDVSVTKLSNEERLYIYKTHFWKPLARHYAHDPVLAIQIFDHSVNASVSSANKLLKNGNVTAGMYRNARHTAYANDPNCVTFCKGWHSRVERVYKIGMELKGA